MHWDDGIIEWIQGPEWDDVALEEFEKSARQLEDIMKANAIWQDITGEARNGLTATAYNDGGSVEIQLYHTAEHGIWLETIQNGKFAIILPTLEQEAYRVTYNAIRRIKYARKGRWY